MSQNTYILVDSDFDKREANSESSWESVEECKRDIIVGIREGTEEKEYLPWRILIFEDGKSTGDMLVHSKITDIVTSIRLEMFGGGD